MIICSIKDAEKSRIFSVKPRSSIHLNNLYILSVSLVNNKLLFTINIQPGIFLGVWYLATSTHDQVNYDLPL